MSWDLRGWTFSGDMRVTDEGMELLFGREAMADRLLWELTNMSPVDEEMEGTLCCRGMAPFDYEWAGDNQKIVSHESTCPWMRAHRFLNRSTDHGHYVHEWSNQ